MLEKYTRDKCVDRVNNFGPSIDNNDRLNLVAVHLGTGKNPPYKQVAKRLKRCSYRVFRVKGTGTARKVG